jgi:dTDP-glucose pyrophosphorylase
LAAATMSHEEVDQESQELLREDWKMDVGKFESFKKSESDLKSIKDKRLRKFYSQQNDWIEDMERIESGQLDKKEAERIGMQNRCINLIT